MDYFFLAGCGGGVEGLAVGPPGFGGGIPGLPCIGPGFMVLCGLPLSGMGAIVNVSYNGADRGVTGRPVRSQFVGSALTRRRALDALV